MTKLIQITSLLVVLFVCTSTFSSAETVSELAKRFESESNAKKVDGAELASISAQCEVIIEEMEAMVRENFETLSFNADRYIRFWSLYNDLKIIAGKDIPELKWVAKKLAAFSSVYESVTERIKRWETEGVEQAIKSIQEDNEPELVAQPTLENAKNPQLTATLVAWISAQCEVIIEEMESIVKQNVETSSFSVVNYLRYLNLYNDLKLIAAKKIPELKWVNKKARAFSSVYDSALHLVETYLEELHNQLAKIETAEPKGKQVGVSKQWLELYGTIHYIATHAPVGSALARTASEHLNYSYTNSSDKVRSTRYNLNTKAISR